MTSVHAKSRAIRLVDAIAQSSVGSLRQPDNVFGFIRHWLTYPIHHVATQAADSVPAVSFPEFLPYTKGMEVCIEPEALNRHSWNVRLDEKIYIGLAIRCLQAKRIFEIGTFNGETTRYMAEAAGSQAELFTLDLPPGDFDATQSPENFQGTQVGEKYRNSPIANQVTQLLGNSTTYDYSPYEGAMDFVFVDAAHDYVHGLADSRTALRLVRPGGVIFWHDFVPYWSGLVHGVIEATQGLQLRRLAGTTLAMLRADENHTL